MIMQYNLQLVVKFQFTFSSVLYLQGFNASTQALVHNNLLPDWLLFGPPVLLPQTYLLRFKKKKKKDK